MVKHGVYTLKSVLVLAKDIFTLPTQNLVQKNKVVVENLSLYEFVRIRLKVVTVVRLGSDYIFCVSSVVITIEKIQCKGVYRREILFIECLRRNNNVCK